MTLLKQIGDAIRYFFIYNDMLNWFIVFAIWLMMISLFVRVFRKPLERAASARLLMRVLAVFGTGYMLLNVQARNLFDVRMWYGLIAGHRIEPLFRISLPTRHTCEIIELRTEQGIDVLSICSLIWLIGMTAIEVWHIARDHRIKHMLKRNARPCPEEIESRFKHIAENELRMERVPKLILLPELDSPCTYIADKPVVALDRTDYAENELDMIIRHELTHITLRHPSIVYFLDLVTGMCWFAPPLRAGMKWIREQMELEADAEVLKTSEASKEERVTYSRLLISLAEERGLSGAMLHMSAGAEFVRLRVMEIISPKDRRFGWLITVLLILIALQFPLLLAPGERIVLTPSQAVSRLGSRLESAYRGADPLTRDIGTRMEAEIAGSEVTLYAEDGRVREICCILKNDDHAAYLEQWIADISAALGTEPRISVEGNNEWYSWNVTLTDKAADALNGGIPEACLYIRWTTFPEETGNETAYMAVELGY